MQNQFGHEKRDTQSRCRMGCIFKTLVPTKPRNRFNVRFWHKADIPLCIEYAVSSPEPVSST
jgi:hypothetical protein